MQARAAVGMTARVLSGFLITAFAGCSEGSVTNPDPSAADTTRIGIDNATSFQAVAGFGGTTLTLVFPNGDHLGSYRNAAIRQAFGEVGISLGSLQVGVIETPANSSDRYADRANDNSDAMVANLAGFNYADLDILRDKIVRPAAAYGYDDLTLGPLLDYRGPLSWLKGIRDTDYHRYLGEAAENVLAVVRYWRNTNGVTPSLIQLFNEPASGNTELGSTSVQEVVDLVKQVGSRLQAEGFGQVKFLVPNEESIPRSLQVARAILEDAVARPFVGAIGYHPYPEGSVYSSPRRILQTSGAGQPDQATREQLEQLKALGQQFGVPIWMAEVSEGPGKNDFGFEAIENVLARAIHIHDNFVYAGAAAFFGMNTIWDSQSHEEHFAGRNVSFLSEQSSIVLADVGSGRILTTGMGYAIGHYARWIRRGAIRIAATSDNPMVLATAFRDSGESRIVVVIVNSSPTSQRIEIQVAGGRPSGGVTGEISYGTLRWQEVSAAITEETGTIAYVIPPQSVLTLGIPVR